MGGGGSARRRLAGASVLGDARGYGPRNLTPKGPGRVVGSHWGFWWPETSRRVLGVADRRRVAAALGGSRCRGEIRASGWHGPMRGVTVKQAEVLAGLGEPRRRGIERRPTHPRRRCPEQSRRCTGRSRRKRVWRGSWARGGTIAVVGEGWKGAVWPVHDGAEDLRGGAVWSEGGGRRR